LKAHRLVHHSTLSWRVPQKKKKFGAWEMTPAPEPRGNNVQILTNHCPEIQGQKMALTVSYVPYSLESGSGSGIVANQEKGRWDKGGGRRDSEFGIQDSGFEIQDSGFGM